MKQWEQSDLGPYSLQYRLPKNISRRKEQTSKVVTRVTRTANVWQIYFVLELKKSIHIYMFIQDTRYNLFIRKSIYTHETQGYLYCAFVV